MKTVVGLFTDLFRKFPLHFISLVCLVLVQALLNAVTVISIAPVVDLLTENEGPDANSITRALGEAFERFGFELNVLSVFILFGTLAICTGVVAVATQHAILRIKYDVLIHLLTDTLGQFFRARFQFFNQGDMGRLLNSFQQEVAKIGNTFGHISQLLVNIMQAVIFVGVAFALAPDMTVMFVAVIVVVSSPLWLLRRVAYRLGKGNTETANVTTGVLHEVLTAAKLVVGFGRQGNAVERYQHAFRRHADVSVKFQTLQRGIALLFVPLGMIAVLVTLYIGYVGGRPLTEMAMVLFAFMRLTPVLGQGLQEKTSIEGFIPAYEQLESLRQEAAVLEEPRGGLKFTGLKKDLRFDEITFSYPGRKPALAGVSLSVAKNQVTALTGKSGSGKTTVVDLMLGLYEAKEGRLLLDGRSLREYDLTSYRNRVGYVPQDPQLFNASVAENLLWSYPEATEQDMWRACRLANAEEFVRDMPEKLRTVLGDRGVRMSGGQRQRLALARAIIRNPDLLILDEATSALDTESERLIREAIEELSGDITIVVIAHRLSTIRNADYVYVLDEGRVVEEGPYGALVTTSGSRFEQMFDNQNQ